MAHGSCRAMHAYVNRVFNLKNRLHLLTDSRREPLVPQGPILQSWFWALAKRLPSMEQVGDLVQDRRWRNARHWTNRPTRPANRCR